MDLSKYLEQEGISTGVYSCHSMKPFDKERVIELSKGVGKIVILEEHVPEVGLTGLVNNALAENNPLKTLSISAKHLHSGSGKLEDLFKHNELMAEQNFKRIRNYIDLE